VSIETTGLYQEMRRRTPDIPAGPRGLLEEFERLRAVIQDHGKYIVLLFPEYTPHDHTRHLDHLFALADRLLGMPLILRLGPSELVLLAFGLYAHDWGMAVSEAERQGLLNGTDLQDFALVPGEPSRMQKFASEANLEGTPPEVGWREYVRSTHGLRSGARLRKHLGSLGLVFADAVAKIAEGHVLSAREVRDAVRYPLSHSVFGETVNLAALTTYVRMVDLLDIGDDRTPYALWKFVAPADPISSMEWRKHRTLSPVAIKPGPVLREVLVSGRTDDPAVFAAVADLRSWIDDEFRTSIAHLRTISGKYDLDLDSRINWRIDASGFEPLTVRFETDRSEVLGLLSRELYQDDSLAFIRELLQNSVDAIDMREAVLAQHGLAFKGEIRIRIGSSKSGLCIEWSDNGIGMDDEVLSSYFARLGRSWYRSREANRLGKIEAISKFGVGVLSCFAVSHQLEIETLKDPHAGGPQQGLVVQIPSRESHFRIRTNTGIPVGTTVRLTVSPAFAAVVSGKSVCVALARIARFVRHSITVHFDGTGIEIGSFGKRVIGGGNEGSRRDLGVLGMSGDSAEKLHTLTTTVMLELGDPAGEYHGHYSAIIPKNPSEARESDSYNVWSLEGQRIGLNDLLPDTEQTLFVKGIQTGPVQSHTRDHTFSLSRYTSWICPKLLVNLRHPSYVDFNLSRSSARLESRDWLDEAWRDIAVKLKGSAFSSCLTSAADTALLLGSCAVFGGVPDSGLDALVENDETPLLVLRSGQGLVWRFLKEFAHSEEFVEAPFELNFANRGELKGFEKSSGLDGWEGGDALFPTERFVPKGYPWLSPVLTFGARALRRLGWRPVEVYLARPPANQALPLVGRIWRKSGPRHQVGDRMRCPADEQRTIGGSEFLKDLYRAAPEVLQFPASIAQHAAIGSRYWNLSHPKIVGIVVTLRDLADRFSKHALSADELKKFSHITSTAFYDYVVPSRESDVTLALEVPNRLIAIAEKEGLTHAQPLVPSDFLPGTIEGYRNPYYYDLCGWKDSGTGLGLRLDVAGHKT
jgi:hypothetical protein